MWLSLHITLHQGEVKLEKFSGIGRKVDKAKPAPFHHRWSLLHASGLQPTWLWYPLWVCTNGWTWWVIWARAASVISHFRADGLIRQHLVSAFSILSPVLLTASSWLWRAEHSVTQRTAEHWINFLSRWWHKLKRVGTLQPHWQATKPCLCHRGIVRTWKNFSELSAHLHAKWHWLMQLL
jgi:hypothetical protein